jgi:oligopeptidase B
VESPHGTRVDPYYWLRDDERKDPEVLAYLQAENAYREARLAAIQPLEDGLYEEIVGRVKQDDSTVPYRKSGYWYYVRFEAGREHPIFARRPDGPAGNAGGGSVGGAGGEQILLDANELARGHEYYRIESLEVSPDSSWLAFCEDTVGRRECALRFKNLDGGEILPVTIANVESDVAWAADNRTVLYVEKDPETLLGRYVKKHLVGTDPRTDALVFQQDDLSFYTGVSKSKSDRFLFISMESTVSSEWLYAEASDPALAFRTFLPRERDHEYQIEHLGDRFVVRTNWNAANFRLMWAPLDDAGDRARWSDLEAHRDDTLIEDFDVFDTFIAVSVRTGGLRRIRLKPLGPAAGDAYFIGGEEAACTTSIGFNAETDSHLLRYSYTSLTTPASIYDYDVRTGQKTLLKRDPVIGTFDPADYHTEFLFAPARDGRAVPVSLVYRKGVRLDAAPLLQYGYGAYGLSMDPAFSASRLSLLDRGVVFAIAHVRGGQEMGRAWYDEGRLLAKRNSFDDFVDVTRFLVARGYAAKERVAAMGGSAGGLLVAAVANQAPEDYRAIVAQVPFVDVVTTMLDESIPLTTNEYDEWGNPENADFYRYLLSYSPYDNVAQRPYPAMLVTTGLWDSQVQYYEPVKWVAKLRALETPPRLLVMHVEMEAGHGGKSGRFQRYREVAREYAFILSELGAAE